MDQKGLLLCSDTWVFKRRVWHDELGGGGRRRGKPNWVRGDDQDKEEDEKEEDGDDLQDGELVVVPDDVPEHDGFYHHFVSHFSHSYILRFTGKI